MFGIIILIHINGAVNLNLHGMHAVSGTAIAVGNIATGIRLVACHQPAALAQFRLQPIAQPIVARAAMTIAQHKINASAFCRQACRLRRHGMCVDQHGIAIAFLHVTQFRFQLCVKRLIDIFDARFGFGKAQFACINRNILGHQPWHCTQTGRRTHRMAVNMGGQRIFKQSLLELVRGAVQIDIGARIMRR